jgi:selenide, water dikinase
MLDDLNGGTPDSELLVGSESGDDAAVVRIDRTHGIVATADFFSPVVDDPYDWGRIAAANALSDVYAMGGRPIVAINLLGWPRDVLSMDLARDVLRGGRDVTSRAGCSVGGGHSIDDPEPKFGMAVTGMVAINEIMHIGQGRAGMPLSLTKPLGIGTLNSQHKETGRVFPHAVETMTSLNEAASRSAVAAGIRCATDVTGFGLLGHLKKLARASGVSAIIDRKAIPYLDDAVESMRDGFVSGGTRRNLDWVRGDVVAGNASEEELLLLADAQTSGGLLVAGEIPEGVVIGELVEQTDSLLVLR